MCVCERQLVWSEPAAADSFELSVELASQENLTMFSCGGGHALCYGVMLLTNAGFPAFLFRATFF
jgi:hypothetical protein